MKRWLTHPVLCSLLLVGGGLAATACSDDWRDPRGPAYENYRAQCAPSCPELTDRALLDTLESRSASELDLTGFDACIECLDSEATEGTCRDCDLEPDGDSCKELLAHWLELDCL